MNDNFIIPLNGLTTGKSEFFWTVGKEFFESFENAEILDAELAVKVIVEKSGRYVGVDCEMDGQVVVECDRCMEDVVVPVETEVFLSIKYGTLESSEELHDGEREVIMVSDTDAQLDMSQIVYDYVCLALPLQRVHEEGDCNPDAIKCLSGAEQDVVESDVDSPFAALKDLLK